LRIGLRSLGGFIEGQNAASWRHGEAIVPIFVGRGAPLGVNLYFGAAPVAPASSPMFVKALPAK